MDLIPGHIADYAREEPEAAFEAPPATSTVPPLGIEEASACRPIV